MPMMRGNRNGNASKTGRNRKLGKDDIGHSSAALTKAKSHVTVQKIAHIGGVALEERLVKAVFCGKRFLRRLTYGFLGDKRAAGY